MDRLLYRRQYILSPVPIKCPFQHVKISLGGTYTLYIHKDLPVTRTDENSATLILLGDIFDYKTPLNSNLDILNDLSGQGLNSILEKSSLYTGRFILIYVSEADIIVFHDATATRKIYYHWRDDMTWLSSQPQLLALTLGFKPTPDPERQAFYHSAEHKRLNNADIGDTTFYDEIRQLMPNHYMNIVNSEITRFWPQKPVKQRPLKEVAAECAEIIRGYMNAIAARYEIMLPVTAGFDSRVLMAATFDIRNSVYYYINKEKQLSPNCTDIAVPKRLFRKLKLKFHIEEFDSIIKPDFREVYFTNNSDASQKYLPHIQHYYLNFSDRVNLPGNCAAASWGINRLPLDKVSGENLARLQGLETYSYGIEYYDQWLKGCRELCLQNNINVVSLFYWEERIANWGGQVATYKDIAQEEFNPFNSRQLLTLFHSVKRTHNNGPDHQLHRAIIKQLWPQLLKVPMNPSFQRSVLKTLKFFGLFNMIFRLKYSRKFK